VGKDVTATFRVKNNTVYHNELDNAFEGNGEKPWSLKVTGQDNFRGLLSAVVWKYSPFATPAASTSSVVQLDEQETCKCDPITNGNKTTREDLNEIVELMKAKDIEYKKSLKALSDEFAEIKKALKQQAKTNETMDCETMISDGLQEYTRSLSNALENLNADDEAFGSI
jgi:hypothetical protein